MIIKIYSKTLSRTNYVARNHMINPDIRELSYVIVCW